MRPTHTFGDTSFGSWALRVFLGCVFLMTGILNLSGQLTTQLAFERMGLPDAARIVFGVLELVVGVLMFVPGAALLAGGLLALLMLVALLLRVINDSTPMVLVSALWLGAALVVVKTAVDRHPRTIDEPIAPDIQPRRIGSA